MADDTESSQDVASDGEGGYIYKIKREHKPIISNFVKTNCANHNSVKVMSYNVLADFYHCIRKVKKLCAEFAY